MQGESFVSLTNAALPGSTLLALNHYIKTMTNVKSHVWYGLDRAAEVSEGDDYGLVANYPMHWLMHAKNDGDVTRLENLRDVRNKFDDSVHLYISDLGLEVKDYTTQETAHAQLNLGQLLLGLYVLRRGGNMMVKMYTFFAPFTKSLLQLVSAAFDKAFIAKPSASRISNSECYLVCLGFNGVSHASIDLLEQRVAAFSADVFPGWEPHAETFTTAYTIHSAQAEALRFASNLFEESKGAASELTLRQYRKDVKAQHLQVALQWLVSHPIRSLKFKDRMNSTEMVYHVAERKASGHAPTEKV
jgi:hypothetical protein